MYVTDNLRPCKLRDAFHHVDDLYHMIRRPHGIVYRMIRGRIAVLFSIHPLSPVTHEFPEEA